MVMLSYLKVHNLEGNRDGDIGLGEISVQHSASIFRAVSTTSAEELRL
jgi:hypothetical protein